ncbi:MAG: hypothetical protein R3B51_05330 [Thermodesulfobacteriota bacterium]
MTATHSDLRGRARNIWIVSGAYEDDFVREAAGWRIKRRVVNAPYERGTSCPRVKKFPEARSAGGGGWGGVLFRIAGIIVNDRKGGRHPFLCMPVVSTHCARNIHALKYVCPVFDCWAFS